jgi:hypothetical protein
MVGKPHPRRSLWLKHKVIPILAMVSVMAMVVVVIHRAMA